MRRGQIMPTVLQDGDPFARAAFSTAELACALEAPAPIGYLEELFCAKEAIFKSLGVDGNHIRFRDISILNIENGAPCVFLRGELGQAAKDRGIGRVEVTISAQEDCILAFAVALGTRKEMT